LSTKKLSRTVNERGRNKGNKARRRQSNRRNRQQANVFLRQCALDPDLFSEKPLPKREPVLKECGANMGPLCRWINKNIQGLSYDEKRGRVLQAFERTNSLRIMFVLIDCLEDDIAFTLFCGYESTYWLYPKHTIWNKKNYLCRNRTPWKG